MLGGSLGLFILNSFKYLYKARNHNSLEYFCVCNVKTEVKWPVIHYCTIFSMLIFSVESFQNFLSAFYCEDNQETKKSEHWLFCPPVVIYSLKT